MVKRLRLELVLPLGADHERGDAPSATARNRCAAAIIGVEGALIPNDEEEPVSAVLKLRASQYLGNLLREPRIGLGTRSPVAVTLHVGGDINITWSIIVGHAFLKRCEVDVCQR